MFQHPARFIALALAVASAGAAPAWAQRAGSAARCPSEQRLRNQATARLVFEEMLSRGRFDENENIYHRDFVVHGSTRDWNRTEDRAAAEGWRKLAPDLKVSVLHILSDCELVAVHWLSTGTATGTGNGFTGTGAPVRIPGMTFFRMTGGQIVEEWTTWDNLALMRQLGLADEGARTGVRR